MTSFQSIAASKNTSLAVVAPATPADCFPMVIEAFRLAVQYMTPVIFLSDGYLANGAVRTLPVFAVETIDTLAAGDVFHGAYIHSYLTNPAMSWEEHFRFARAAAAYKIIAVPTEDKRWEDVQDLGDINKHTLKEFQHFLETYKALKGKPAPVEIKSIMGKTEAIAAINKSIALYKQKFAK